MTPPKDRKPPAAPGRPSVGAQIPLRRLLRTLGGFELWHVEEAREPGHKWPVIRYEVGSGSDGMKIFERPHEAWRHFQQLTHAPDKDMRPEPPPIDGPPPGAPPKARKTRRRRPGRTPA
jgi:hypothetical protein